MTEAWGLLGQLWDAFDRFGQSVRCSRALLRGQNSINTCGPVTWVTGPQENLMSSLCPRSRSGRRRWILHLGPARGHEDADADQHDRANGDPHGWNVEEICGDRQPDDQDDEADQVGAEGGHFFS